jgi:acyl dehydratase
MIPAILESKIGSPLGQSQWVPIEQDRINAFADVTEDFQFIHIDEEAAARTPFGGTIAHGYLILSMTPKLIYPMLTFLMESGTMLNYGSDKLRFMTPVRSGKSVRASLTLNAVEPKGPGFLMTMELTIEVEGSEKPAIVCELLSMYVPND